MNASTETPNSPFLPGWTSLCASSQSWPCAAAAAPLGGTGTSAGSGTDVGTAPAPGRGRSAQPGTAWPMGLCKRQQNMALEAWLCPKWSIFALKMLWCFHFLVFISKDNGNVWVIVSAFGGKRKGLVIWGIKPWLSQNSSFPCTVKRCSHCGSHCRQEIENEVAGRTATGGRAIKLCVIFLWMPHYTLQSHGSSQKKGLNGRKRKKWWYYWKSPNSTSIICIYWYDKIPVAFVFRQEKVSWKETSVAKKCAPTSV